MRKAVRGKVDVLKIEGSDGQRAAATHGRRAEAPLEPVKLLGGSSCSCALAGTELARTVRG